MHFAKCIEADCGIFSILLCNVTNLSFVQQTYQLDFILKL